MHDLLQCISLLSVALALAAHIISFFCRASSTLLPVSALARDTSGGIRWRRPKCPKAGHYGWWLGLPQSPFFLQFPSTPAALPVAQESMPTRDLCHLQYSEVQPTGLLLFLHGVGKAERNNLSLTSEEMFCWILNPSQYGRL